MSVQITHGDCLKIMPTMADNSVDFTLTDIPYGEVNRSDNGLRKLTKEQADILTFGLTDFLSEVYRITKNNICIFCGREQFSEIHKFFTSIGGGSCRPIVWEKSNPSPMNGQYVYLSGVEFAVWFKKQGSKVFNARCKNVVFKYPNGTSKLHPTEKNHKLLRELILDNTNEGDMVFDPCMGSGSHLLVAAENGRNGKGVELNEHYFGIAKERLSPYTCSNIGSIIDRIRRIKDEQQSTGNAQTC